MPTRENSPDYYRYDGTDKQRDNCRDTSYPKAISQDFSGGEKGCQRPIVNLPKLSEPLCENRVLQGGGSPPASRPDTSTGLDGKVTGLDGEVGCLSPCLSSPRPSASPNLPVGRE